MLSKSTTDQIRKEADAYLDKQGTSYPVDATYNRMIKDQIRSSYETGATAWAVWKEKADAFEKALKWYKVQAELAKQTKDTDARLSIVTALELDGGARATKALEQWK